MDLKTLINYYNTCPVCDGNIIINTDLSIPSTVERTEHGLLVTVYDENKIPLELRLNYSNTIESNRPFILSEPYNALRRALRGVPSESYDRVQLELSCIDCGNFTYWSNNIIPNHKNNTIGPIFIRNERLRLNNKFILSNDLKNKELSVYTDYNNCYKLPFAGSLKSLPLKETEKLVINIKKQLILS